MSTKRKGSADPMRCAACGLSRRQHAANSACPKQPHDGWTLHFVPQSPGRTR